VLIRILLGALFKKLDITKFGTEKSDCRFGTFRLDNTWDISEFIPLTEFKYCLEK